MVAVQQSWALVALTFVVSIAISFLVVHVADFEARDLRDRKIFAEPWVEALTAYAIAFALSYGLLFVFGYISPNGALEVWLPQVIALSYATSLGGAAGRIVL